MYFKTRIFCKKQAVAEAIPLAVVESPAPPDEERCSSCYRLSQQCRTCELVDLYREQKADREAKESIPDYSMYDEIPITSIETTFFERYTLQCERCLTRKNPETTKFVGVVCGACVFDDEREWFEKRHAAWNPGWSTKESVVEKPKKRKHKRAAIESEQRQIETETSLCAV